MPSSRNNQLATQQLQGWRTVVEEYITLANQAESEQDVGLLGDLVVDSLHLDRLDTMRARIRERERSRQAACTEIKTEARLKRISESNSEASVLIASNKTRTIQQMQGEGYTERRLELERVWLQQESRHGAWRIHRIEPIIGERRARYGKQAIYLKAEAEAEEMQMPNFPAASSMPYLNYDILRDFKPRPSGIPYRRDLAAAYADRWWNEANHAYEEFEVNCTNYVSQCLFAGGAPMNYTGKRATGWWYKGRDNGAEWWSYSWSVSNALQSLLAAPRSEGLRAELVSSANELQLGDVILYDWDGDGRYQHSTIVTAFDQSGVPLVNANTTASRHRYWDYRDSYAWNEATVYRFFHISDVF